MINGLLLSLTSKIVSLMDMMFADRQAMIGVGGQGVYGASDEVGPEKLGFTL